MKWSVLFAVMFVGTNLVSANEGFSVPAAPAAVDDCSTQQAAAPATTCEPNCAAPLNPDQCFPACAPGQELCGELGYCSNGGNGCDPCGCDHCKGKGHRWKKGRHCDKCDDCYCDRCCRKWKHLCEESTCDMYQHHAYYPMLHGYYYFRPYNYQNVVEQKSLGPGLGEKYVAPYQTTSFAMLYRDIESGYDTPRMWEIPKPKPTSEGLPDLQEILKN